MFHKNPMATNSPSSKFSDSHATATREKTIRVRLVKVAFLLFFLVVVLRLIQVQVVDSRTYKEKAQSQYENVQAIPQARGPIYDRTGQPFVTTAQFISFGVDPAMLGDRARDVAGRFAHVFAKPPQEYLSKIFGGARHFVWLERRMNPQFEQSLDIHEYPGLVAIPEPVRLYPNGKLAGQLLGFTDVDSKGLSGIELQVDSLLRGKSGTVTLKRDGMNRKRLSVDYPRVEPINGDAVYLTIDIEYQAVAEEELRKGIEHNKAECGIVAMMDPFTGEILAMASYPPIDPGNPAASDAAAMRNKTVTDTFEPGSVFKLVTASAALDHKIVRPTQKFDGEQGTYVVRLANGKVRNKISDTHKHGIISFQEAMEVSSNIVMAKVSDLIGPDAFYTMARAYGFGALTGIELPGEVRGELKRPTEWSGTTLNSMSYGYEVSVTPLQILSAYAVVANQGTLMKPYVIARIVTPENEMVYEGKPEPIRRVISKEVAEDLTQMFLGVVERGTGTTARLGTIAVAGKTGTARKVVDGKYMTGDYTASFVGFFPAKDPKAVCLVMIENPRDRGYTGGLAAAPVFKAIAERISASSRRFAFAKSVPGVENDVCVVPDVTTMKIDVAKALLSERGFETDTRGSGSVVGKQFPNPGSKMRKGIAVILNTVEPINGNVTAVVPDLRGLSIRRALNKLSLQHLEVAVEGSGIVESQRPLPGEVVKIGTQVDIRCDVRKISLGLTP